MANTIKASELLKKIEDGEWEAEVVDDEDCYPQIFDAELEADGDGALSLTAYYGYRQDSPRYGVSLGKIVIEIDGVTFTAGRIAEGEIDGWEISGAEIDYDNDLTEDDLTKALNEGDLPHYCPDGYEFIESEVSVEDLVDACDTYPEFMVETEDGDLLGFDDEDDVPEGAVAVELSEVIERLYDDGEVSYDFRG